MEGVRDGPSEHRGQPRRLELWVGGAWILGVCAMVGVSVLLIAGGYDSAPAHPRLAWSLVVVWLASFITAYLLQNRYEQTAPPK